MLQQKHVQAAGLFALLLNLKHIYIYVAPAFFVYLLKHHCFSSTTSGSTRRFLHVKFIELAAVVVCIFTLSFGPFIYYGQLSQVLSRLFPFKRGLCHAYWAPNFWTLYSALDILLATIGFSPGEGGSMTSGIVGEMKLQVLPSIPPVLTLILTATATMPSLMKLWKKHNTCGLDFLHCLILCGYASFMFGWHVHEKAIMMVTMPMCLLAMEDGRLWRIFTILSTAAHISLFPLLFNTAEKLIKVFLFVPYIMMALTSSTLLKGNHLLQWELKSLDVVYTAGCVLVQIYCLFIHGVGGYLSYLEFLPLLFTSVTCALGVTWTWFLTITLYLAT
ncbi:Probable dolichyl pyrophosphate Glc1Man9GlcNAc2 alpha-1,3-glucosyltransferase [Geodia barretti]|nr:Probable dolichyl pyrophosphate Glc1Man9GlcNAc2 alpha-1,3-glucosyltransferase [Geodia barretti]